MEIVKIATHETYLVRNSVLRPGKSIESCYFDGDILPTTCHFGIKIDNNIAGIVSVFENKNSNFTSDNQLQVRGMAVLETYQKNGFGEMLLVQVESYAKVNNFNLIWFNARKSALNFYKKLKYQTIDVPFEIAEIGTHYVMFKQI